MVVNIVKNGEFIVIFEESSYLSGTIHEEWLNLHQLVSLKFFKEFQTDKDKEITYLVEIVMTNGTNRTYRIPETLQTTLKKILNLYHNGKTFFS